MLKYVMLDKEVGQTPLETLQEWKAAHPEYKDVPASYAGRLDPMASGKLLILLGDECRRQDAYIGLDKEYEVEVLLDIATDTGDVLGLPAYVDVETHTNKKLLTYALRALTGTHVVPYPVFSSKTVNGKPLLLYALEDALDTIQIPTHKETIYKIEIREVKNISKAELQKRIFSLLGKAPTGDEPSKALGADFRVGTIRPQWERAFNAMPERNFALLQIKVICASGTYMRTLAGRLATELGTTGLALSIHRTKIGRFAPFGNLGFWIYTYT